MFRRNFLLGLLAVPFASLFSKAAPAKKEPPFMEPGTLEDFKDRLVVFRHYSPYQFEDMGCKLGIMCIEPVWAEMICGMYGVPADVMEGQAAIRKIERMAVDNCWLSLAQPVFFRSENPEDEEYLWACGVRLVRDTITLADGSKFNTYSLRRMLPAEGKWHSVRVCKTFT